MSERMSDEHLAVYEAEAQECDGLTPGGCRDVVAEARRAREAEHDLRGQILLMRSTCGAAADRMEELREDIVGLRKERDAALAEVEVVRAELRKHIIAVDDVPTVQLAEALGVCLSRHQQELREAGFRHAEEIRGYQASLTAAHAERDAERARAEMAEQTRDQLLEENARLRAEEEDGQ